MNRWEWDRVERMWSWVPAGSSNTTSNSYIDQWLSHHTFDDFNEEVIGPILEEIKCKDEIQAEGLPIDSEEDPDDKLLDEFIGKFKRE